jgi:hypothetical protein
VSMTADTLEDKSHAKSCDEREPTMTQRKWLAINLLQMDPFKKPANRLFPEFCGGFNRTADILLPLYCFSHNRSRHHLCESQSCSFDMSGMAGVANAAQQCFYHKAIAEKAMPGILLKIRGDDRCMPV